MVDEISRLLRSLNPNHQSHFWSWIDRFSEFALRNCEDYRRGWSSEWAEMEAFNDFWVFKISIPGFTTFPYTASFQVMIRNWQGEMWINDDFPWLMICVAKNELQWIWGNLSSKHLSDSINPPILGCLHHLYISLYYTSPGLWLCDRTWDFPSWHPMTMIFSISLSDNLEFWLQAFAQGRAVSLRFRAALVYSPSSLNRGMMIWGAVLLFT